ncbi:hypothetical protein CRG98_040549 [Punica granatum]|uniref:Bet v I/Major latex protein domain-containing protein n=1 Tax=Punica granatum TaxID=22663 RepID=A0A2I0I514_PUNGR|nr:hypothetical protein CRG98_040549 [Punica granatum]
MPGPYPIRDEFQDFGTGPYLVKSWSMNIFGTCIIPHVSDGERKAAKEKIEAIDDEKSSTTFRVVDGDLMKLYKKFILIFQATPKKEGTGSVARWTLEYEKLSEEVPEPYATLEFCAQVTKDIDSHLTSAVGA